MRISHFHHTALFTALLLASLSQSAEAFMRAATPTFTQTATATAPSYYFRRSVPSVSGAPLPTSGLASYQLEYNFSVFGYYPANDLSANSVDTSKPVSLTVILDGGNTVNLVDFSGLAPGSKVTLTNNTVITGADGSGVQFDGSGGYRAAVQAGSALKLAAGVSFTIDNTNGTLLGGPGGGGMAGGATLAGCLNGTDTNMIGAVGYGYTPMTTSYGTGAVSGNYGQPGGVGTGVCTTAGGPGGLAVQLNGANITWLGGFNSTQVQGAVQ